MNGYTSAAGQVRARESWSSSETDVLPLSYTANDKDADVKAEIKEESFAMLVI